MLEHLYHQELAHSLNKQIAVWIDGGFQHFYVKDNTDQNDRPSDSGWKLHISLSKQSYHQALTELLPLLARHFSYFKVILPQTLRYHTDSPFNEGKQITAYLCENAYSLNASPFWLKKIADRINQTLLANNIAPGRIPESDAALEGGYLSIRNDSVYGIYLDADYMGSQYNPLNKYNPYRCLMAKNPENFHISDHFSRFNPKTPEQLIQVLQLTILAALNNLIELDKLFNQELDIDNLMQPIVKNLPEIMTDHCDFQTIRQLLFMLYYIHKMVKTYSANEAAYRLSFKTDRLNLAFQHELKLIDHHQTHMLKKASIADAWQSYRRAISFEHFYILAMIKYGLIKKGPITSLQALLMDDKDLHVLDNYHLEQEEESNITEALKQNHEQNYLSYAEYTDLLNMLSVYKTGFNCCPPTPRYHMPHYGFFNHLCLTELADDQPQTDQTHTEQQNQCLK